MISRSVISGTRLAAVLLITITIFGIDRNCHALQYEPIDAFSSADECALVLDGPGRSSVFDYTYNLLRGSFPPSSGSQTCITYDAVNHAYIEARKRIHVAQPNTETWRGEDLATVGELLLDISINLAQKYGLTYEDIEKGLPLIDTSKTLIREVCPAFLSNVECRPGKYRRYDGLCTNLDNPTWGATMTPFSRLLPPKYADGINAPRTSVTGNQLPLARVVSRTMHPDDGYHDHAGTVMVIAWGQFMDHDYTLTATPLDSLNRNDPEECCHRPPHLKNPYCNEILIPEDDYFYRLFNVRCMDFVRGFPAPRPGCRLGSRVQFNLLTGVLDGNTVYGVSEAFARKLRTGYGGLLRMNPVFSEYGLKDLLPLKLDIPDEGCTRPNRSMYCFEAGEIRVNEQLVLTCMHTLLAREHNRAANALAHVNPHWDDETIFQEARRIVIAEIQHVTYNEFLPILLGKEVMEKFGLLLEKDGYWDGYDPSVNPGVIDAFAAAAYRFGHSLLPTAVERWSKAHKFIASKRLSDLIRRPYDLYRAGVLDEYFMGLMNQVAQAMDDSITQEVTNHLFKKVGAKFGMDLVSFNMQRGREFGLPSYMEFRKFCGLPGADTFEELFGSMPNETIRRYSSIFEHPSDVDLWSGGVSERPLPGSMLGPTFACIIATQFSYSRRGDRFWYELPNQPSSFTPEQLTEIRKARLSRLICDNTDLIDTIQIYPMVLPDHEINPRVPCRSGILPSIDFSKWAEFPPSQSDHAAQYNFLRAAWPFPGRIFMPPLAYRRMHSTPNRRVPTSIALELAGLHPAVKRSQSLYVNREILRRKRKPKTWPTILIERSTRIYGEIPSVADDNIRGYQGRTTRPDYFFERSEVAISPIIDDIFRGKRYSIKNLFNDLSMKTVSKSLSGFRFRRDANYGEGDVEKSNDSPQTENNYSRLLKILSRDRVHGISEYDADNARDFHRRSKRHVAREDKDFGGKVEAEEKPNNDVDGETEASQNKRVTRKHRYTPVFKECNDTTAASEVADLNAPPPPNPPPQQRRATLTDYYRNGGNIQDIDSNWNKKTPRNQNKYDDDSKIPLTTIPPAVEEEDEEEPAQKEAVSTTKNETYINLQDHQKDAQVGTVPKDSNGYPVDIPAYNPDVIPYVDVPDYSDQREESLDKDDRKVAKEKYVEYPDEEADVIDPGLVLANNGKRSEKIIVRDEDVQEPEEVKEEIEEERGSDEEEAEKSPFTSIADESDEDKEKENEETISKNVRSDVTDDTYDFGPIHFDIEEYRKPFNLEELFKDIEKEVEEKNATKGDVNEHQGSKNIPVRGDSNEARGSYKPYWDDGDFKAFESPLVKTRGDKLTEKNVANNDEKNSPQDSTLVPPNFFEEFDRVFGPAASDKPFFADYFREDDEEKEKEERLPASSSSSSLIKNDDYPYGDENTYENLFATDVNGKKSKSESKTTKDNDDDDDVYYKKYSDHDVADFLEEKKADAEAEEPYKTLATILDKKDDISRLDDEVSTKAKMEGKVPNKYNNFWTLEYGSPDRSEKT